jgi:uncharacterized Tic20 family protein
MSDQPLNTMIRLRATACHLSGLSWFPAFYLLMIKIAGSEIYLLWCIPLFAMLVATLLTTLIYLINQPSHAFLDRSGRCALNLMLSYSLYLIVSAAFLGSMCGISATVSSSEGILLAAGGYLFMVSTLFFVYSCCSLVGGIYAWQGKFYSYPYTIKFLNESPLR